MTQIIGRGAGRGALALSHVPGRGGCMARRQAISNPEWKLYSHFLKRRTRRAAVARLQAEDSDRDLSDILQELLES